MSAASLAHVPSESRLWRYVGKLLHLRWVLLVNGFRRAKLRAKIGMVVLGLLILAGLGFAFFLSWLFLRFLNSPQLAQFMGNFSPLLESIPVLVISASAVVILFTSFGVLLQALYLAGDMDFLLSAPIPIRAIFITKLMQAILPNLGLVLLFGLPVLYGLGVSMGYTLLYYPLVLIVLVLMALAIGGLASLLVMAVVRVFPARRVAEVLGFLVAIFSFICSQSGQLANYANVSADQATRLLSMTARLNTPWSPLAWIGRGLVDIGEGRWLSGFALFLLTILLASGIFAVSLATAERLYYSGWASVQVSATRKKGVPPRKITTQLERAPATRATPLGILLDRAIPTPVRGIIAKDFLMLRRDLRNMSQLVTPLILGILYAFMLIRSGGQAPAGRGEAPAAFMALLQSLMTYANIALSLFVGWTLLSRLAAMGFSQEGKNYWMVKVAPISAGRLLAAKYLVAYLPTLSLVWLFLLIISLLQRASLGVLVFGLAVVALIMAGTAGINLAFGVVGANFKWEDPRRISQGGIGCLGAIVSLLFFVVSLTLFFGPTLLLGLFNAPQSAGQLVGLLLGGAFSLACALIPLWLVRARVPRLAED
jgi:ABC-2 type transport system permease protein